MSSCSRSMRSRLRADNASNRTIFSPGVVIRHEGYVLRIGLDNGGNGVTLVLMATEKNGTLVRTDLTKREYARIRKQAIDADKSVGAFVGDTLRQALLKGSRP
jgi:hypothetical protein